MARILFSAMDPSHTLIVFLLFTLRAGAREKNIFTGPAGNKISGYQQKTFHKPQTQNNPHTPNFQKPAALKPSNPQAFKP